MKVGLGGPNIGLREKLVAWKQLSSGQLAQGKKVAEFEQGFKSVSLTEFCVAVNSGTSALHIGLMSAGIGPGDEVIVPSFTFAATANSVALTGATPIFCDVEQDFFTLDPLRVEALITKRTKAIMTVHLYGQMSDMSALQALAKKHNLQLFEDAAQAHGAALGGKPAGSWGDFGAFSFYPTKNMTTGEGGLIATSNPQLARASQLLRNQGMLQRYKNEVVGLNNRMTEVAAAIGLVQLTRLKKFNESRMNNADYYFQNLSGISGIQLPQVRPNSTHVFHQFTLQVQEGRDLVHGRLAELGVDSGVYYPTPVHQLPAFAQTLELPVTARLTETCLSLPIAPSTTKSQLRFVVKAIRQVLQQ